MDGGPQHNAVLTAASIREDLRSPLEEAKGAAYKTLRGMVESAPVDFAEHPDLVPIMATVADDVSSTGQWSGKALKLLYSVFTATPPIRLSTPTYRRLLESLRAAVGGGEERALPVVASLCVALACSPAEEGEDLFRDGLGLVVGSAVSPASCGAMATVLECAAPESLVRTVAMWAGYVVDAMAFTSDATREAQEALCDAGWRFLPHLPSSAPTVSDLTPRFLRVQQWIHAALRHEDKDLSQRALLVWALQARLDSRLRGATSEWESVVNQMLVAISVVFSNSALQGMALVAWQHLVLGWRPHTLKASQAAVLQQPICSDRKRVWFGDLPAAQPACAAWACLVVKACRGATAPFASSALGGFARTLFPTSTNKPVVKVPQLVSLACSVEGKVGRRAVEGSIPPLTDLLLDGGKVDILPVPGTVTDETRGDEEGRKILTSTFLNHLEGVRGMNEGAEVYIDGVVALWWIVCTVGEDPGPRGGRLLEGICKMVKESQYLGALVASLPTKDTDVVKTVFSAVLEGSQGVEGVAWCCDALMNSPHETGNMTMLLWGCSALARKVAAAMKGSSPTRLHCTVWVELTKRINITLAAMGETSSVPKDTELSLVSLLGKKRHFEPLLEHLVSLPLAFAPMAADMVDEMVRGLSLAEQAFHRVKTLLPASPLAEDGATCSSCLLPSSWTSLRPCAAVLQAIAGGHVALPLLAPLVDWLISVQVPPAFLIPEAEPQMAAVAPSDVWQARVMQGMGDESGTGSACLAVTKALVAGLSSTVDKGEQDTAPSLLESLTRWVAHIPSPRDPAELLLLLVCVGNLTPFAVSVIQKCKQNPPSPASEAVAEKLSVGANDLLQIACGKIQDSTLLRTAVDSLGDIKEADGGAKVVGEGEAVPVLTLQRDDMLMVQGVVLLLDLVIPSMLHSGVLHLAALSVKLWGATVGRVPHSAGTHLVYPHALHKALSTAATRTEVTIPGVPSPTAPSVSTTQDIPHESQTAVEMPPPPPTSGTRQGFKATKMAKAAATGTTSVALADVLKALPPPEPTTPHKPPTRSSTPQTDKGKTGQRSASTTPDGSESRQGTKRAASKSPEAEQKIQAADQPERKRPKKAEETRKGSPGARSCLRHEKKPSTKPGHSVSFSTSPPSVFKYEAAESCSSRSQSPLLRRANKDMPAENTYFFALLASSSDPLEKLVGRAEPPPSLDGVPSGVKTIGELCRLPAAKARKQLRGWQTLKMHLERYHERMVAKAALLKTPSADKHPAPAPLRVPSSWTSRKPPPEPKKRRRHVVEEDREDKQDDTDSAVWLDTVMQELADMSQGWGASRRADVYAQLCARAGQVLMGPVLVTHSTAPVPAAPCVVPAPAAAGAEDSLVGVVPLPAPSESFSQEV